MNDKSLKRMENITQVIGTPGYEKYVSRLLQKEYKDLADEIIFDNLGSIYTIKKSVNKNAPRIMISAHMDEVGFMISQICNNGLLKFVPLGGIWEQTLLSQRIRVMNDVGEEFKGNIVAIPPHFLSDADRAKPMQMDKMFMDIGCVSKEEVKSFNIHVGDVAIIDGPFVLSANKKRVISKAWDNRYGCIMGIEILEYFKGKHLPFDLYVGANVQEEVGLRGATTASNMIQPDLGIIFDCSPSADSSGDPNANGRIGAGVLIRRLDRAMIPNRKLINDFEKICIDEGIAHQNYFSAGGTDAGEIHKAGIGVPTLTACICARNIHSNSSMIDLDDFTAAKKAIIKLIENLNEEKIKMYKCENR